MDFNIFSLIHSNDKNIVGSYTEEHPDFVEFECYDETNNTRDGYGHIAVTEKKGKRICVVEALDFSNKDVAKDLIKTMETVAFLRGSEKIVFSQNFENLEDLLLKEGYKKTRGGNSFYCREPRETYASSIRAFPIFEKNNEDQFS